MPNARIFCNVPWTNTHIYWDGSYGACCAESEKLYQEKDSSTYNLKQMSLTQWLESQPLDEMKQRMLGNDPLPQCKHCYKDEAAGFESKRIQENFKTIIFTEQAFDRSFDQNPIVKQITHRDPVLPIDWHVDLGNECNLACKMCGPALSSKIAAQYRQWNIIDRSQPVISNWTEDDESWQQFLHNIEQVPALSRLHFMGGEPLLNRRFESLLDYLIDCGRHKTMSISFVTNGTIYRQSLIDKLKMFTSCDLEVSLETVNRTNNYIRQGSSIEQVLGNIEKILAQTDDNFQLIMRPAPQLLSVNSYYEYIEWCYDRGLPIQSIPVNRPAYMKISVLPRTLRLQLVDKYRPLQARLQSDCDNMRATISLGRNKTTLAPRFLREVNSIINLLEQPEESDKLKNELIGWLSRWDQVYKLDACEFYPEYADFFKSYGYKIQH